MTNHSLNTISPEVQEASFTNVPYPPSFVDRIVDAVEGLRVSYWLVYLALFGLQSLTLHLVAWYDGSLTTFALEPLIFLYPLWLWGPLVLMTFLDRTASDSFSSFRPLIHRDSEDLARLEYELKTMPGRNVVISGVIWVIIYFILLYLAFSTVAAELGLAPLTQGLNILSGLASFFIGSAIYYHSIRQLRFVSRTVNLVKHFDMFRLEPVYAFSRLTARTGAGWLILSTLTLMIFPIQYAVIPSIALFSLQASLAIAAFALPLWSVHQRLEAEKSGLQSELDQRVKSMLIQLHHAVDEGELKGIGDINTAIAGLAAERDVLSSIPTWPWRARTLTGFLSLIALPVVLFIIQLAIENWLTR